MSDNRFGIKEVADVWFYQLNEDGTKGEPVLCLDTLKVSNIEQTAESTDAKGGKGDAPLIIWDYNKEINITLEDALLSETSLEMVYGKDEDGIITISANTFPGVYYVIGRTFARDMKTGKDRLFSFVIPKAKIMSENSIAMEAEGDPTVFNMSLRALRDKNGKMVKLVLGASEDDLRFEPNKNDDGLMVAGFDSALDNYGNVDIDLIIPAEHNGQEIDEIASGAFARDQRINSVTINPKNLNFYPSEHGIPEEEIVYPFEGCDGINSVKVKGVEEIGWNVPPEVRAGMKNLSSIECVPATRYMYSKDNCLIHANEIKSGVITKWGLEWGCQDSIIPKEIDEIESYAFQDCTNLTEIVIPSRCSKIYTPIFTRCPNLTKLGVELGNTVYGCQNNTIYYNDAFDGLTVVQGCKTSDLVGSIAFETIGDYAFGYCSGLTTITIPSTVTYISSTLWSAFEGCTDLTDIYLPGHAEGSLAGAPWGAVNATIHWNEEAPE